MRLPIRVFDLFLTLGGPPAAQILDEAAANRAVQFLKQLAEGGLLRAADGAAIPAAGVHYRAATRELEVPHASLKATRAAGLLVDDDALEALLPDAVARRAPLAATPLTAEPLTAEPLTTDQPQPPTEETVA